MKSGDIVGAYRILEDQKMTNAGMSVWTFAEKEGVQYFIKQFLKPKYPMPDAPISAQFRSRAVAACERFQRHHQQIIEVLRGKVGPGGNLIVPLEIFLHETSYYKVTERVKSDIRAEDVFELPFAVRLIVLRTAANSLKILHDSGLVHGDLKPSNIMLHQTQMGAFVSKLIDFDDSYFSGHPPRVGDGEEILVDPVYSSPELILYSQEDSLVSEKDLTTKSDIFTMGLVYCLFLTGSLPKFSSKYTFAYEAVLDGSQLTPSRRLPSRLATLLQAMWRANPTERPNSRTVSETLNAIRSEDDPDVYDPKLHASAEHSHSDEVHGMKTSTETSPVVVRMKGKPARDGKSSVPPKPPTERDSLPPDSKPTDNPQVRYGGGLKPPKSST